MDLYNLTEQRRAYWRKLLPIESPPIYQPSLSSSLDVEKTKIESGQHFHSTVFFRFFRSLFYHLNFLLKDFNILVLKFSLLLGFLLFLSLLVGLVSPG